LQIKGRHTLDVLVTDMRPILTRFALFWDFTERIMVVCYRNFGTIYRSSLQGSSLVLENGISKK